jgi:hypothetical protein
MQKTPRRPLGPSSSKKRSLQLAKEHIRTLTADELPLVAGGCPTGSWPSESANTAASAC